MSNKENKDKLRKWKQKGKLAPWKIWTIRIILLVILIGVIIAWPRGFVAVVGGLAIFVLIVFYWIRYKIKKWWGDTGLENGFFPTDVHITNVSKHQWKLPEQIQARTEEFEQAGFIKLGDYAIEEMSSIKIRAFMLESECLYGVIYEDSLPQILIDITTTYENGKILTYTTTQSIGLEQPSYKQIVRMPQSTGVAELLHEFRGKCTDNPCVPVSSEDFPERITRSVEEENQWRTNFYQELERRDEELVENYLIQSGVSGIEWEKTRDRIVFIHSQLSKSDLVNEYTRLLNDENQREYNLKEFRAKKLFDEDKQLEVFSQLINDLPDDGKPQKVAELDEPLKAHVYLYPELLDDDYDDY